MRLGYVIAALAAVASSQKTGPCTGAAKEFQPPLAQLGPAETAIEYNCKDNVWQAVACVYDGKSPKTVVPGSANNKYLIVAGKYTFEFACEKKGNTVVASPTSEF